MLTLPFAIAAREWPLAVALAPTLLVLIGPGCSHKRTSLRPVFVSPGAVAAPATVVPESCPPGTNCPPAAVSPGFDEPTAPSSLSPVAPPAGPIRAPSPTDEPGLVSPPSPTGEPSLQGPSASWRTKRRGTPRAALRSRLGAFVKDPDDLFTPPKADRPWKYVILHHSANPSGNYAEIDRDHRQVQGWTGCGYHFVIGNGSRSPDGQIEVAGRWTDQKGGAHCRDGKHPDVNEYGIGICLIGDLDRAPPTARQIEAARALVAYLSDRYAIPTDHVGPHAVMAHGPTACPGKNFPADAILGTRSLASR